MWWRGGNGEAESVSDLSPEIWAEIERQSVIVRGQKAISLWALRNILRKSRRTSDQNSLLWALYEDAIKQGGETLGGWTKDDIHEYMLGEYHGWEKKTALGRTRLKPVKRSSRMTKAEFSDYVAFVVKRFAEHGIVLELPGDPMTEDAA
jgi:hypothetical protein